MYLLSEFGLSLLARSHDDVSHTGRGQAVLSALNAVHGDDGQTLGTSVVAAVKACGHGKTCGCLSAK